MYSPSGKFLYIYDLIYDYNDSKDNGKCIYLTCNIPRAIWAVYYYSLIWYNPVSSISPSLYRCENWSPEKLTAQGSQAVSGGAEIQTQAVRLHEKRTSASRPQVQHSVQFAPYGSRSLLSVEWIAQLVLGFASASGKEALMQSQSS